MACTLPCSKIQLTPLAVGKVTMKIENLCIEKSATFIERKPLVSVERKTENLNNINNKLV
jgi:hypothetical protein